MTWYDSRLLGLEANWSPDEGLTIKQSQVTSSYVPYKSERRNATAYRAQIPASAVTINGKAIDNTKEEYPLLSFRNVRYFPLTWRFAHDEFGWDYKWDAASGLSITSHNTQLQTVGLPAYAGKNDVALFKGYYYFVETTDTKNHVYRAPVKKPSDKEEIYSYNHANSQTDSDLLGPFSFQIRENTLWFTYHLGGGVMGSDYFVKIGDGGKAELLHSGYLDFRDTPYGTLIILLGASAFEAGNLSISPPGQDKTNHTLVGDSGFYGVHIKYNSAGGEALIPDSSTSVIGDDVYVLASHGQIDLNRIHRINLKTNKIDKIVDTSVSWFRMIDNKLYYVKDEDNALYSSTLEGTGEMKLSEHAVSWFDSIDGNLYYTTKKEANQFELYKADQKGVDPLVWKKPVSEVRVLNNQLIIKPSENKDYGIVLLDSSGHLLLSVADQVSRVLTSDKEVLLQSSRDSSIKLMR
ncbi:unnamed protein product [Aphanomyces euteiches]